jgi:hypothetical protein
VVGATVVSAAVVGVAVVGVDVVGVTVVGVAVVDATVVDATVVAGSVAGALDVSEPLHAMRPQPAITTTTPRRTSEECVMRRTLKF